MAPSAARNGVFEAPPLAPGAPQARPPTAPGPAPAVIDADTVVWPAQPRPRLQHEGTWAGNSAALQKPRAKLSLVRGMLGVALVAVIVVGVVAITQGRRRGGGGGGERDDSDMASTSSLRGLHGGGEATATSPAPTSPGAPSGCYTLVARLNVHPLQRFEGNPDANAWGLAYVLLCTNGTVTTEASLHAAGTTPVAASINLGDGGDGAEGNGRRVISFSCLPQRRKPQGEGQDYAQQCTRRHDDVDEGGLPIEELAVDIASAPQGYYFVIGTSGSEAHFAPATPGAVRGPLLFVRKVEDRGGGDQ